jgi:hypothetical protein
VASMTICPVAVPSGDTVPSPSTRSNLPRTVIVLQKCLTLNSAWDACGSSFHCPASAPSRASSSIPVGCRPPGALAGGS